MASNSAKDTHNKIKTLLSQRKLHEAFKLLETALSNRFDPLLNDVLKKQEETYKYLIHYLVEGYQDSGRARMLDEIVSSLHFVNDSILRSVTVTDSPDVYSSTLRFERIRNATFAGRLDDALEKATVLALANEADGNLEVSKAYDDALQSLFAYTWTMFGERSDTYNRLVQTVKDPNVNFDIKAQLISALMLGNLRYFDRRALSALIDIYEADIDIKLTARSLVAILLVLTTFPDRVAIDPALRDRLSLWSDNILLYSQLREVAMSVITAHDTKRISSKMKNEVLPELMKLRPEILDKMKNASQSSDLEMLEVNPEWEDIMDKTGLGDKLKELTEMQMEGGDVMMMAFSNLKSFPFFNTVANWFLPFSSNNGEVLATTGQILDIFNRMLDMDGVMCDSDKYSFVFSLGRMPEEQRKLMADRMSTQLEQLKEALERKKLNASQPEFGTEVTRYIRDMYRFFKLYKRHNEFVDPFEKPFDFEAIPFIKDILGDSDVCALIGEFYFKHGYYAEALPLLMQLSETETSDNRIWEKIGYCHNALGNFEEAMKWYRKAELLRPDSLWLIKKMAVVSRLQGDFEAATELYERALENDPDNFKLLMSAGNCYIENDDPQHALAHFYHADYLNPDRISTWRAVAWAEFMAGNFEKSLDYYDRILDSAESNAVDYLNAGHADLVSGNLKKAIEMYRRSARHSGFGIEQLETSMLKDLPVLERLGADAATVSLIIDKVKYDLG